MTGRIALGCQLSGDIWGLLTREAKGEDKSFTPTGMFQVLVLSPRTGTRFPETGQEDKAQKEPRSHALVLKDPIKSPRKVRV